MDRVKGKVALITGAARGQGRSHALLLAQEGADIVALDACRAIEGVPYDLATEADLADTEKLVADRGVRVRTHVVDVRDQEQLDAAVAATVEEFGHLDVVVANAGICTFGSAWELGEQAWQTMLDINLTGTWKTTKAVIPQLIRQGSGGSIILTSSIAGVVAYGNVAHYVAAKHGVTGLMRALAVELGPHRIRVNSVHPTSVNTEMINNQAAYAMFTGGRDDATVEDVLPALSAMNGLPIPWVEPIDVSYAVVYLASEESRYVSGTTHAIDGNAIAPFKIPHE